MKKERKNEKIWLHTQNPRRFSGFTVVVVTFFVKILDDFHDFVSECVSFPMKINNPFWEVTVFPKKVTIFIGHETKIHIFSTRSVLAWKCLPRGMPPPRFFTLLGNGSHSIFVLCLPSERGMGLSMPLAVPVSSGMFSGRSCPRLQLWNLPRCPSQSLWQEAPSMLLQLSCPRALRRQTALTLRLLCAARVLVSPCCVMVEVSLQQLQFMA